MADRNDPMIIGRWGRTGPRDGYYYYHNFKSGGSFETNDVTGDGEIVTGSFMANGETLILHLTSSMIALNYEISGNKLSLLEPVDGVGASYTKA